MTIAEYIRKESADKEQILKTIHEIIIHGDPTVTATVAMMMGKEMIIYKCGELMKYGLAVMKNCMSLHVMPVYANAALYEKYKRLLPKANFQKGCINFTGAEQMPPGVVRELIQECARVNLATIREEYIQSKKKLKNKKV